MISAAEIKKIRSLHMKKFRDESGLFLVEGEKMVAEALNSDFEVVKVLRKEEIGEEAMSRLSLMDTPSPVLAVVRKKLSPALVVREGLCLGLDAVRDPGNMGTILRIADWFGVSAVYCSDDCVDIYNPKTVQSTMGAIFHKEVIYCNLSEACRAFASEGRKIYGTFLDGSDIYREQLNSDAFVLMGNESNGISAEIASYVSGRLNIPSFGGSAESLNVAVATAVTVSEFRRR